ncbi:unnamed protein product [Psylliodes chrysocephalus]|uniref:Mutator-like transposase domain-containing protein n=1 Tax=Psylliodes chrysocephalus TaxID=3402493 RepID=A0A9P0D648_9CUCU|nr:unnamed protein product [Psylliodes chrysocephala]
MHRLKYRKLVADGDSSLYANIMMKVSYGMEVEKIECKNHAVKNYGKALYKLQKDTKLNVEGRKLLTVSKIKELQNISKRIIYENVNKTVDILKTELENGPNHVFEDHFSCSENYCTTVGNITKSLIPTLESSGIFYHIKASLDRLIMMAGNLRANETNNKAEMFMSLLCKFNAGKRLNLTQRGSLETRAYIAALRYNLGICWEESVWENVTQRSAGEYFKKYLKNLKDNHDCHKKRRTGCKKKSKTNLKRSETDYGNSVPTATISNENYESEVSRILKRIQVSMEDIILIESKTGGQWDNPQYRSERRNRLTASVFGEVVKRRKTTPCHNLVKKILYETNFTSEAMLYIVELMKVLLCNYFGREEHLKILEHAAYL